MTTRRDFLKTAAAATGAAFTGIACGGGGGSSSSGGTGGGGTTQPPNAIPANPLLVVLTLDGGWDWLNVLPPIAGANAGVYQSVRPNIHLGAGAYADLGQGIGMNGNFLFMDQLHGLGRVAWIAGVGMDNFSLSHFQAIDNWAEANAAPNGTGWLGRFADAAWDPNGDVLRGLTVTSDVPLTFRGLNRSFVSIPNSSGYVYPSYLRDDGLGSPYDAAGLKAAYAAAVQSSPATGGSSYQSAYAAAASYHKLFYEAQNSFGTNGALPDRTPSVLYPGDEGYTAAKAPDGSALPDWLAYQLKLIAQMIASGLPTQVYFARLGGWDTHGNELATQAMLLRVLGASLKAFYDDLKSINGSQGNAQDRVMVMVTSEFGRRVAENNGGTDHGTAGLSFCLGRSVKGGFYGAYPDLTKLDSDGNMKYSASADYRSLYATVLDRWLGQPTATTNSLLGATWPRMSFI